jgi:hypothetical protein
MLCENTLGYHMWVFWTLSGEIRTLRVDLFLYVRAAFSTSVACGPAGAGSRTEQNLAWTEQIRANGQYAYLHSGAISFDPIVLERLDTDGDTGKLALQPTLWLRSSDEWRIWSGVTRSSGF